MAKQALTSNKVKTMTISDVEITAAIIDYENDKTIIQYIIFLDDGTPFQRGAYEEAGSSVLDNTNLYTAILAHLEANL